MFFAGINLSNINIKQVIIAIHGGREGIGILINFLHLVMSWYLDSHKLSDWLKPIFKVDLIL